MSYVYSIFIDLPIVLLVVYSICEIIWSHKLAIKPSWVFTKAFFLLIGTSLAYLILSLGNRGLGFQMPEIQNSFFLLAVILFSILSSAYILKLIRVTWAHEIGLAIQRPTLTSLLFRLITRTQKFLIDTYFVHVLAFLGLLLILVSLLFGQVVGMQNL